MSEHDEGESESGFVSIGARLRRAREARGMSLDDVAGQTRIPMRHLQHIEIEDWDALPAPTYAIGFARNYANAVGLDGPAIASELRDSIGGPRRRAPPPEYYEPADPARVPPRSIVIAALVLAVLLVGGYLIWRSMGGAGGETTLTVPEPATGPAPEQNQPAAAPTPEALAGRSVTLNASGDVWVRITEGRGGPQIFQGILAAGQRYTIPAAARQPVIRTGRPQLLRASAGDRDLGLLGPEERLVENVSLRAQDLAARLQAAPPAGPPSAPPPGAGPGTGPRL
ncbi:MAG: cytoskeleton protein RodZ [Sphingomonadales bacterium]|jgi:transcriptional regulator with XRE-family HTH domain|nr:cytoskeleton protein RodZ [Sphingomonadales bacterium]